MPKRSQLKLEYARKGSLPDPTVRDVVRESLAILWNRTARRLYLGVLIATISVGYLSDYLAKEAAENDSAKWWVCRAPPDRRGLPSKDPFWVQDPRSIAIFKRAGFYPAAQNPFGPPWDRVEIGPARFSLPFRCEVPYSHWSGQYRTDGKRVYLCFFARIWLLRGEKTYEGMVIK